MKGIQTITSELSDYPHIDPRANDIKLSKKLASSTVGALSGTIQRQLTAIIQVLKEEYKGRCDNIWFYRQYDELTIVRTGYLDTYPKFTSTYRQKLGCAGTVEIEGPQTFARRYIHSPSGYDEDIIRIPEIAEDILCTMYENVPHVGA